MRYFEQHLGDGAYIYLSEYREVVLYTSNGITETNTVVIENAKQLKDWISLMEEGVEEIIRNGEGK